MTPDEIRARDKAYYQRTKDRQKSYSRTYYAQNRDRINKRMKQWFRSNRDKDQEYRQKRRNRLGAGTLTSEDIGLIKALSNGFCAYCLRFSKTLHLEHCTPLCRGGSNSPDNVVFSCARCNLRKHHKTVLEFLLPLKVG